MKRVSDKEYEEYKRIIEDKRNGRLFGFDAIELIVKANDMTPEKIGRCILEAYYKAKRDKKC